VHAGGAPHLGDALVCDSALGVNHLLALLRVGVVKAAVDLALLVLQRDVGAEDEAVLEAPRHVGVP